MLVFVLVSGNLLFFSLMKIKVVIRVKTKEIRMIGLMVITMAFTMMVVTSASLFLGQRPSLSSFKAMAFAIGICQSPRIYGT